MSGLADDLENYVFNNFEVPLLHLPFPWHNSAHAWIGYFDMETFSMFKMMSGSFVYFTTRIWWWPSIFLNFQYFWTKTFWDSYTSIRQIFSTWQWFPSIWCYYIWICKNVQYLNEKPVKVEERSKFTIVNMFSMHINNFFFYFIYFSYSLRTVYFLDCLYLGLLGVGTSLFPPFNILCNFTSLSAWSGRGWSDHLSFPRRARQVQMVVYSLDVSSPSSLNIC